jgi:hypothetical protein
VTLPPTIIFKGQTLNSNWIPSDTPSNWCFSTSNKGWTSALHGFEWIKTRFEPLTHRTDGKRRLLIFDGHSSHLTARFLQFCITKDVDLALLPPHTSHITQPLDVSCFGPLKTAINFEIDRVFRNSDARIHRSEWTSAYNKARERYFRSFHIESGFRNTGIYPFNPKIVLDTLERPRETPPTKFATMLEIDDLSRILRERSTFSTPPPLNLREIADDVISRGVINTPSRRFIRDIIDFTESRDTDATLLRRELREKDQLLNTRKIRKKGKRVVLKGKIIVSRESIQRELEKLDKEAEEKKKKKGKKTKGIVV